MWFLNRAVIKNKLTHVLSVPPVQWITRSHFAYMAWTMGDLPYQPEQYTRTFLQPAQRSSWQRSGCQPGCQRPGPRNSSRQKGSWRREPAGYSSRHWAGWQSLLRRDNKREGRGRVTLGHRQRTLQGQTASTTHNLWVNNQDNLGPEIAMTSLRHPSSLRLGAVSFTKLALNFQPDTENNAQDFQLR